jgi:hypothetical protein
MATPVFGCAAPQEGFGSLAVSVTGAGSAQEGKDYVRKHQELHGKHDMLHHAVLCRAVLCVPYRAMPS